MANIVDELLKVDPKKADELQKTTYKSKRLGRILGKGAPVEITLQELPPDRLTYLSDLATNKDGTVDTEKSMEAAYTITAEAVIEPDLTDKDLKAHFNAELPIDLAKKLFGLECANIVQKVNALSIPEDEEETIKN